MYGGADALLEGANRPLDLTDVTVGGHDVEMDGSDVVADAFELLIGMYVRYAEPPRAVKLKNGVNFL